MGLVEKPGVTAMVIEVAMANVSPKVIVCILCNLCKTFLPGQACEILTWLEKNFSKDTHEFVEEVEKETGFFSKLAARFLRIGGNTIGGLRALETQKHALETQIRKPAPQGALETQRFVSRGLTNPFGTGKPKIGKTVRMLKTCFSKGGMCKNLGDAWRKIFCIAGPPAAMTHHGCLKARLMAWFHGSVLEPIVSLIVDGILCASCLSKTLGDSPPPLPNSATGRKGAIGNVKNAMTVFNFIPAIADLICCLADCSCEFEADVCSYDKEEQFVDYAERMAKTFGGLAIGPIIDFIKGPEPLVCESDPPPGDK